MAGQPKDVVCPTCKGSGLILNTRAPGRDKIERCPTCGGTGRVNRSG